MFLFSWPHQYSTLILEVFPLDQFAHVGVSPSIYSKLISREITFEILQRSSTYVFPSSPDLNVTDRQTDRQTDGRHIVP